MFLGETFHQLLLGGDQLTAARCRGSAATVIPRGNIFMALCQFRKTGMENIAFVKYISILLYILCVIH